MGSFVLPLLRRRRLCLLYLPAHQSSSRCTASSVVPLIDGRERRRFFFGYLQRSGYCTTSSMVPLVDDGEQGVVPRSEKWLTLPPFSLPINADSVGENSVRVRRPAESDLAPITALKWIRRCCPSLPESLVQKLFRLRQVRRETKNPSSSAPLRALKRISGKELLNFGDVIHLPATVKEFIKEKKNFCFTKEEFDYVHSLQLHKDESIIVVNKPSGLPVQGGVGIKLSMDMLAGACLKYDYVEPPRLVHRLDRESSGVLVLGRTQNSASLLHYIFREKTHGAVGEMETDRRILRKKYWALVFGSPRRLRGVITAPLRKINLENKNNEHITLANLDDRSSSQHAITEYEVVKSSSGFTWLELCPLTGRKHQLRVHCAEALGTPIVGDSKYGWSRHKNWRPFWSSTNPDGEKDVKSTSSVLLGMDLTGKSILEEEPSLHLHCRQMVIPDISVALRRKIQAPAPCGWDFSDLEGLEMVAPLPPHMETSWEALKFSA